MTKQQTIGRWGEDLAAGILVGKGYQILAKNVHTPYGEIDLIARGKDVLLFVEVKTRTNMAFGTPESSVSSRKKTHMIQSAEAYLQQHPDLSCAWQIDVIAIQRKPKTGEVEVLHFENAIC